MATANPSTGQRFLDPAVLAGIASLDLVARTVVDGFIAGLHRSPDFGFSQEFAEYRSYTPGDDLRHVDWNVFARSGRVYLKRFRGETNTHVTILLDSSASMGYSSGAVTKLDYARFLAASLAYLGNRQRDATGLIVFHEKVEQYVHPSTRQGQLARMMHAIESASPGHTTAFHAPFLQFQQTLSRRGIAIVISDFYEEPERVIRSVEPLRFRGNDLVLFHVLDAREVELELSSSQLLRDMETGATLEVSSDYARHEYRARMDDHCEALRRKARAAGAEYFLLRTDRPLDTALREYFNIRRRRL
ncbi:MAG TPA: DUF58 domain-containing protein [Bryobacteraceae bacterium]|jgi:uncharacterized protein (DUF58 family)|nr:DUF58 domain-containing protein [Bryobacteraceae bacterium]